MPKLTSWMTAALAAVSVLTTSPGRSRRRRCASAAPSRRSMVRRLSIKTREGTDVKVKMTDNVAVFAVVKTELSQIKEGSYIGVSAMPQPDGTQKAFAVHIFPENQRGAAEGFRPWDARANSTMTNATVAETVKGTDGQNILVKYKDGEKKVVVPPDAADRHLRRQRQVGSEAGRQADHLRRGQEGRRHAGSQPRQCRPRRDHAADVMFPLRRQRHPGARDARTRDLEPHISSLRGAIAHERNPSAPQADRWIASRSLATARSRLTPPARDRRSRRWC